MTEKWIEEGRLAMIQDLLERLYKAQTTVEVRGRVRENPWSAHGKLHATIGRSQWSVDDWGYGVFHTVDVNDIRFYRDKVVINIKD